MAEAVRLDADGFVLYCCPAPACHFGLVTAQPSPATTRRLTEHLETAHPGWTIAAWRAFRSAWEGRIRRAALS